MAGGPDRGQARALVDIDRRPGREDRGFAELDRVHREREAVSSLRRHVVGRPVEDAGVGRDRGRCRNRRIPPLEADLVVGERPPVVLAVVSRVALDRHGDRLVGRPHLPDLGIRPERQADGATGTARRQESRDGPRQPDQPILQAIPGAGQRLRGSGLRQQDRCDHGHGDEDRPAPQVDRRDRGWIPDPPTEPLGLLVEDVRADEQQERGDTERDEQRQLVVLGHAHVRDKDHADHDHGAERSAMSEDRIGREHRGRPHQQGEDQDVMEVLRRRREVADGDIHVGRDHRSGRRVVQVVDRRPVREGGPGDDDRDDERREDRADEVCRPAPPADLGADEAGQDATDGDVHQAVEILVPPQDPACIVEGQRHRDAHQRDETEGQPTLDRLERRSAVHRARSSPSALPGVMT